MLVLLLAASLSVVASGASPPALDDAAIAAVNANPASTWTAGRNSRFEDVTLADASRLLGAIRVTEAYGKVPASVIRKETGPAGAAVGVGRNPISFDSREQYPGCVGAIRNQEHCGACWAFAAAEVLSDRFCIASNGTINVTMAPQDLISCGHVRTPPKYMLGCDGGVPEYAWKYVTKERERSNPRCTVLESATYTVLGGFIYCTVHCTLYTVHCTRCVLRCAL